MKRNGIINFVRCWLIETFGESSPYKEIIPRNYLHALQMNSFSIEKTFLYGDGLIEGTTDLGIVILPYDEHFTLIDDCTMLEIFKTWIESEYENTYTNAMGLKHCIKGIYVSDSGSIFNQYSTCIVFEYSTMKSLADMAILIKQKIGADIVLIHHQTSHRIYGV